jgi:hypothetical protein
MWGFPVQDIAITLYYLQGYDQYPKLRSAFERGYTTHKEWPEACPGQIEALLAGRGLDLANLVLQDPNPDWQQEAPAFFQRIERRLRALLDAD